MTPQIDFGNLLKETIGLDPVSVGSTAIDGAVRLRMTALGISYADQYWELLSQSQEELQELIETAIVPETWFFRDQEAFAVLAGLITQSWLPNHPKTADRIRRL